MKKILKISLLLLSVALAIVIVWAGIFYFNATQSQPPMPNPNGYENFVAAGKIAYEDSFNYADISQEKLRALVATNEKALKIAREGLRHDCLAPNNYSPSYIGELTTNFIPIKRLAWAFRAEGRLAELENRTNDAAKIYLETIQLGQKSSRGGVIITRLIGTAIEIIGMRGLTNLTNAADPQLCKEVLAALKTAEADSEPASKTIHQETVWRRKTYGLKGEITTLLEQKELHEAEDALLIRLNEMKMERQNLELGFANRAAQPPR